MSQYAPYDGFDIDYPYGQILTASEIKDLDRAAVDEHGMAADHLMKQAAQAVFEFIVDQFPDARRVTVACGRGNNGGDGILAARLLANAGRTVECLVAAERSAVSFDVAGLAVTYADDPSWSPALKSFQSDLVVDAVLGIGATGPPQGAVGDLIDAINGQSAPVVSIDVPSGIDADTGDAPGPAVCADHTVVLGYAKPFLFASAGVEKSGTWHRAPLDYPDVMWYGSGIGLISGYQVKLALPERGRQSHKGDNGHVLIVAGSPTMPGAAVLAARGALRAGAGLVTICSHPSVCTAVSHHLPEVLLWPVLGSSDASSAVAVGANRFDAAVFGPGLGQGEDVRELLRSAWEGWVLPCVVDADALNLVAARLKPPEGLSVLTPHPGEMGRLMGASTDEIQADRFGWAKRAAEKLGEVVVLKGAYSVVSKAGQGVAVNPTGNPGMATGGMGDVLAGVIGTLLAQRVDRFAAARCGVYWHGLAGDICRESGAVGFTASEVADRLPQARKLISKYQDPRGF